LIHFPATITAGSGATATGSPDMYFYLTQNGGGIVHADFSQVPASAPHGSDNIFFAAPVETGTALSSLAGTYSGLVFDNSGTAVNAVLPVKLTCDTAGQCIGSEINADTDATVSGSDALISLVATDIPSAGFMTGTIDRYNVGTATVSGTPGNLACAIDTNANSSGKNVMNCVAQSPDGTASSMFNVFFVQR